MTPQATKRINNRVFRTVPNVFLRARFQVLMATTRKNFAPQNVPLCRLVGTYKQLRNVTSQNTVVFTYLGDKFWHNHQPRRGTTWRPRRKQEDDPYWADTYSKLWQIMNHKKMAPTTISLRMFSCWSEQTRRVSSSVSYLATSRQELEFFPRFITLPLPFHCMSATFPSTTPYPPPVCVCVH